MIRDDKSGFDVKEFWILEGSRGAIRKMEAQCSSAVIRFTNSTTGSSTPNALVRYKYTGVRVFRAR